LIVRAPHPSHDADYDVEPSAGWAEGKSSLRPSARDEHRRTSGDLRDVSVVLIDLR
jgi:hypothetical protein